MHTCRNLASNELTSLPYDAFEQLHVECSISVASNRCAQQPCGTGLQWYQAKQGVEFCASGLPSVVVVSDGPSNSSDLGNATIPQPDADFPGALVAIVVIEVVVLCVVLAWLCGCRFWNSGDEAVATTTTKSVSDEELAAPPLTPSPMQHPQASK